MTTYDEWRVTGTRLDQPFKRIFSPTPNGRLFNRGWGEHAETAAREFIARTDPGQWTDGPHLHKRTVTLGEWEQA